MMISAKYKHLVCLPPRLIDHRSPEVRENLSYSCHEIKIQRSTFLPFLGPTQLPFVVMTRAPISLRTWFVDTGHSTCAGEPSLSKF